MGYLKVRRQFLIICISGVSALGAISFTGCSKFMDMCHFHSADKKKTEIHTHEGDQPLLAVKEHHHDNDHMEHMNEVREMLKENLFGDYEKPLSPFTKEDVSKGEIIYQQYCANCHGVTEKGDGPMASGLSSQPADFTDSAHASYYSDRGRLWIIQNGIPGTPMVGWGDTLGTEGTRHVYAYVQSLREQGKHMSHDHHSAENAHENHEHMEAEHDIEGSYICPMKHEGSKSDEPGKCPVCGMDLIKMKELEHEHD